MSATISFPPSQKPRLRSRMSRPPSSGQLATLPAAPEAHGVRYAPDNTSRSSRVKLEIDEGARFDSDEGDAILLEDLHNDLAYLRSRAVAVCRKIDQVLARSAPMNKLPIESTKLLSRVFELGSYRDLLFATTVDAVCQPWHRLARKSPSIWGNIVLNEQWKHDIDAFQRILNQCLTRSGRSPILVDLDLYPIETVEVAQSLLAAIAPHIARCYSFAISVPQPEWIDLIGQHFGGQLAAKMESMALRFKPTSPWAAAYVQSTILQGSMPLLHTLTLEGLPLTVLNVSLPGLRVFEYKQFEELYSYPQNAAAITPIDDLWHVLSQAPNIEDLRVEYSSFSIPDEALVGEIATKVTLPRLKTLTVGHVDAGVAHVLMQAIEAPKLDKLIVRCDPMRHHQDAWFIPTHWAGNLQTLILDGFRILDGSPAIGLTRFLSAAKGLKKLSITTPVTIATHTTATPQFFSILCKSTLNGWLCPEMREFTIANCNLVTGHELLKFIKAREESCVVPKIQFLGIKECAGFDVATMEELERRVQTVFYLPPQSPPMVPPSPVHWHQGPFYT